MNKTENVSIGRMGFVCDKDAYNVIARYLERCEKALGNDPDRKDILADLEISMAEHLRAASGELVVDKKTAETVIQQMGEVDGNVDVTYDSTTEDVEADNKKFAQKLKELFKTPLYKDRDRAIGDGVCAGLARTLDIDPVWVRLIFVILLFITQGFMFIVYIALDVIMKDEPSRKRKTAGQIVNDIRDTLHDSVTRRRGYEVFLRKIFISLAKGIWLILKIFVCLVLIIVAAGMASAFFMLGNPEVVDIFGGSVGWVEYSFILSSSLFLLVPLYELLGAMIRPRPSRSRTTVVLWSTWALSLIILVASALSIAPKISDYIKREAPKNKYVYVQKTGDTVSSWCISPLGTCEDTQTILTYETVCGIPLTIYSADDRPSWQSRGWTNYFTSLDYPASPDTYCETIRALTERYGLDNIMFAKQEFNARDMVGKYKVDLEKGLSTLMPTDKEYWTFEYMVRYY